MSEQQKITRFYKSHGGELQEVSTNCDPLRKKLITYTDKLDEYGCIYRKTLEEAEKDPTPDEQ